jgi:hypothetical protein
VRELGRNAAEIVPDPAQNCFDLGRGFIRKGGGEIVAANSVFLEPGTERAHEPAGEIGHVLPVGCANHPQHCDRERS